MIVVLLGKSASGKDATLRVLRDQFGYEPIISLTTRPMREKEIDGVDYNFVSLAEFNHMIQDDTLIEYRSYNTLVEGKPETWYYGAVKFEPNPDKNYVVVLDVEGTQSFIDYFGRDRVFVVNICANDDVRMRRAMKRGSFDATEWNRRLEDDAIKFAGAHKLADVVILNNAQDSVVNIARQINEIVTEG